jgi:hypothetical protein
LPLPASWFAAITRNAIAKPRQKAMAKHTTLKKAKPKVQPTSMNAKKPTTTKKRSMKTMERVPVAEKPVETTTIDIIEESASSVVAVTQYESVQAPGVSWAT